jgi:hypothetical protein
VAARDAPTRHRPNIRIHPALVIMLVVSLAACSGGSTSRSSSTAPTSATRGGTSPSTGAKSVQGSPCAGSGLPILSVADVAAATGQHRANDPVEAALLLQAADLPPGWTSMGTDTGTTTPSQPSTSSTINPKQQALEQAAARYSCCGMALSPPPNAPSAKEDFVDSGDPKSRYTDVTDEVWTDPSADLAHRSTAFLATPTGRSCVQGFLDAFASTTGLSTAFPSLRVESLSLPGTSGNTTTLRITTTDSHNVPTSYSDVLIAQHGRAVANVTVQALRTPPDPALDLQLLRALVARLANAG